MLECFCVWALGRLGEPVLLLAIYHLAKFTALCYHEEKAVKIYENTTHYLRDLFSPSVPD